MAVTAMMNSEKKYEERLFLHFYKYNIYIYTLSCIVRVFFEINTYYKIYMGEKHFYTHTNRPSHLRLFRTRLPLNTDWTLVAAVSVSIGNASG